MPPLMILSAGDYAPLLHLVSSSLQTTEFQVFEVADGMEAVRKAQELQPDLVLLDIGLQKLDGIEAAKRIRELAPQSRLLFVSQESNSDMVGETFRVGAQGYVHMQSARNDLPIAIEALLGGKRFLSRSLERRKNTYAEHRSEELVPMADDSNVKVEAAISKVSQRLIEAQ